MRPLFENSTVCLKIDAKNPVLMGRASWGFGLVVVVSDGFSFGCEIVAFSSLPGAGGQCFTARDQYGSVGALFRVLIGFLLRSLVSNGPFGGC